MACTCCASSDPQKKKRFPWELWASGALAVGAEAALWLLGTETHPAVVAAALASMAFSGRQTLMNGVRAALRLDLSMNFLMTIAIVGAALLGSWPEAAMVCFLFTVAERIEDKAAERARNAIKRLLEIAPSRALIKNEKGEWEEVDAERARAGDVGLIRPGERIAFDGTVMRGSSHVDQSPITGESLPVPKGPGDAVYAGSINGNGPLEYRITADAGHTTLSRIIHAVEVAQASKAPAQKFVDRFARVYTPAVVALAAAVAVVPPLATGAPFHDWVYKALVLLVIACPCALVLSTPVTVVSGLAKAARMGILVKGGVHLERGRHIRTVALDKTGTVTKGKPEVTDVGLLDGRAEDEVKRIAASLNAHSEHPIGKAIRELWEGPLQPADGVESLPGLGLKGTVDGVEYMLGNHRLIEDRGLCGEEVEALLREHESQGKTAAILADGSKALAVFAVADAVKPTSREAVEELSRMGVRTVMLSGDNRATAEQIARSAGIAEVKAELLPEDKLLEIETLKAHGTVAMAGDGINDAPALAGADIGIAMGALGTDAAVEAADVALMDDDLRKIPAFIKLSRRTVGILKQNIAIAIGVKALFFGLAFAGYANLWMAVFADMGGSLVVIANGLRLIGRTRGDAVS